jgi:hypothetical protein
MFRIGEMTGIDIPGETRGNPPSAEWKQKTRKEPWYPGDTISISIGQGLIAVTPTQMASMMSAVANGGTFVQPHLVRGASTTSEKLPVSAGTLALVRDALTEVVEEGTATKAQLGPISVAGKTGTAQVFKKSAGIDADKLPKDEKDHAWFVGYAPADKPEIAFAIVIEHGGHGGTTAAPVARKVLEVFFEDRLPKKEEAPKEVPGLRAALPRPHGARRCCTGGCSIGSTSRRSRRRSRCRRSACSRSPRRPRPAGPLGLWTTQLVWLTLASAAAFVVVAVDYHIWAEFSLSLWSLSVALLVAVPVLREGGGRESLVARPRADRVPALRAREVDDVPRDRELPVEARARPDPLRPGDPARGARGSSHGAHREAAGHGDRAHLRPRVPRGAAHRRPELALGLGAALVVRLPAPVGWNHLKPYQRSGSSPSSIPIATLGVGYQVRQSKIAVGSGRLVGKGLFKGTQNR